MKCSKCGAQLPKGEAFCGGCGSPVEETKKKIPMIAIGIAVAVVLVIVIAAVAIFLFGKKDKDDQVSADATVVGDTAGDSAVESGLTEVNPAELTPLYNITDVAAIDIYAQNYTPGEKQEGIVWDSTLFYWLEDIDQTSSEDGYLSRCHIGKTLLRNAENGQLIQYEIYRDPNTSEIYKIVSIEQAANGLKLTDYYYDDGKPNFVFMREDSVYTPTYATPSKTGERYYFAGDVMARWRMIRVPNEIGEYVLTPTDGGASYSQANYFTESAEIQQYYDETEMRMLNAAYNTYNAVSAESVGLIEGRVQDTTGAGIGDLMVDVLRKSDNVLLYRGTTADDGSFRILTYLDNTECYIVIRGNSEYKESSIYGVFLADSGINNSYNNLLLHKVGGDEYPVYINVYSAADVRTGEDGTVTKTLLPGSKVSVRAGVGAYTGDVILTAEADAEGRVHANLQSGSYTLQIETPGCCVSYLEVEVAEQETAVDGYVLPSLQEDKIGIVLTWDGADTDLDLTLFTPYQSTGGDMAHISSTIPDDGHGNQLLADNGAGCEVMYVNTAELGNYKLYVNNYTDTQSGNYDSNVLAALNVHIYIYDINGFVAEYSFPAGQTGVVWEVVDISGKQLTPSNRVYKQIEGKSWWMENKEESMLVQRRLYERWAVGTMLPAWAAGNYEAALDFWCEYSYDAMGNQTKEIRYNGDGSVNHCYEYSYDAMGNQTKMIEYNGDGSVVQCYEDSYDAMGNKTKEIWYDKDGSVACWYEYSYDAMGNKTKAIWYNGDGSVNHCYEYDAMGNQTKMIWYDEDGSVVQCYEDSYDAMGNKTKEIWYDEDGSVDFWYEYSYDSQGNMLKECEYDSEGAEKGGYEYVYDENGNLLNSLGFGDDVWSAPYAKYAYDEKSRVIYEEFFDSLSIFVYDGRGNLKLEGESSGKDEIEYVNEYIYDYDEGSILGTAEGDRLLQLMEEIYSAYKE